MSPRPPKKPPHPRTEQKAPPRPKPTPLCRQKAEREGAYTMSLDTAIDHKAFEEAMLEKLGYYQFSDEPYLVATARVKAQFGIHFTYDNETEQVIISWDERDNKPRNLPGNIQIAARDATSQLANTALKSPHVSR